MAVFVIWESRFTEEGAAAGAEMTRRIWSDMRDFEGYLGHQIIQDLDDPGHLLIVSRWLRREVADAARDRYTVHENARRATSLAREPRRPLVGKPLPTTGPERSQP